MENKKKIVCLGGGTGVSMILSGLADSPCELNAIVTMFDDGGSSGRIAKEFRTLPPGDIRQCLIATSRDKDAVSDFRYRFEEGFLKGHNFGNLLILKSVSQAGGDWNKAIEKLRRKLNVKVKIYPVTLERARIKAVLNNNKEIIGEENIINSRNISRIGFKRLYLKPRARANPRAISAIRRADLITIGPGKFYTSVISNLLVKGIPEAIRHSKGKKVFICNLMTQEGNTDNFKVKDFVEITEKYLGKDLIDYVMFNTGKLKSELMKKVKKIFPKINLVKYDKNLLKEKGFIGKNFLDMRIRRLDPADVLVKGTNQRTIAFHDSKKLAKTILNLCRQ
jgi:uncharacterized cofD-like protein